MYSDDFKKGLIRATIRMSQQSFLEGVKKIIENPREFIECSPSIKTNVTDKDMLLLRIDMALDSGDEEAFRLLTDELGELEGVE